MSNRRRNKRFWKSFLILFLIYLVVIPAVFYLLDAERVTKLFSEDSFGFILKMTGIAAGISLIINIWTKRDPELKEY